LTGWNDKADEETDRMKSILAFVVGTLALGGVAYAQTPASTPPEPNRGYIEGVAQASFGNVTSQSYGAEAGYRLTTILGVFVESGYTKDVASSAMGAAAQQIADYLTAAGQSNVSYTVKQPAGFGQAGVRIEIPMSSSRITPYVLGGLGVARVKQDVKFFINGADVTTNLPQYGVVLGSDLAGQGYKMLLTVGGGAQWPLKNRLLLDLQLRYGRIFTDPGTNVVRAGVGFGMRF
jgi:opacity protein-like surface antigen